MPSIEGFRSKFRNKIFIPLTCKSRGKKLKDPSFTIISNNCWGGTVYEAHNLPKESPTVGLFFMAEDYIKFISHLKEYLASPLVFIQPEKARWKDAPEVSGDSRFGKYPVGRLGGKGCGENGEDLDEIEIFFLHYHSEMEARDKWERRIKRINWERMLVKFNDQNGCRAKNIEDFIKIPFKNKVFFTCREWPEVDGWADVRNVDRNAEMTPRNMRGGVLRYQTVPSL